LLEFPLFIRDRAFRVQLRFFGPPGLIGGDNIGIGGRFCGGLAPALRYGAP
jgi:hypothetical protein